MAEKLHWIAARESGRPLWDRVMLVGCQSEAEQKRFQAALNALEAGITTDLYGETTQAFVENQYSDVVATLYSVPAWADDKVMEVAALAVCYRLGLGLKDPALGNPQPSALIEPEPTKREQVEAEVYQWLQESTGGTILDSGDYSGRAWEDNQKHSLEDFRNQSVIVTFEMREYEGVPRVMMYGIIPVFSYLVSLWLRHLTVDEKCRRYQDWLNQNPDWGSTDPQTNEVFTADGALGAAGVVPLGSVVNTYNSSCTNISQHLQYQFYRDPDTKYVYICISIHQGCDVRGGYTVGRLFKVVEDFPIPCEADDDLLLNTCPRVMTQVGDYFIDEDAGDVSLQSAADRNQPPPSTDDREFFDFLLANLPPERIKDYTRACPGKQLRVLEAEVEGSWFAESENFITHL